MEGNGMRNCLCVGFVVLFCRMDPGSVRHCAFGASFGSCGRYGAAENFGVEEKKCAIPSFFSTVLVLRGLWLVECTDTWRVVLVPGKVTVL